MCANAYETSNQIQYLNIPMLVFDISAQAEKTDDHVSRSGVPCGRSCEEVFFSTWCAAGWPDTCPHGYENGCELDSIEQKEEKCRTQNKSSKLEVDGENQSVATKAEALYNNFDDKRKDLEVQMFKGQFAKGFTKLAARQLSASHLRSGTKALTAMSLLAVTDASYHVSVWGRAE